MSGAAGPIEINPQFSRALGLLEEGRRHLFITGKAGTGKSTLLAHFRAHTGSNPVILAPTGVAALNVGGETVHRFFRFGIDVTPNGVRASGRKPRNPDLYRSLTSVVIDEASMLRADLLDCVDAFLRRHGPKPKRPFGGVQMVFVGDLYQLPPVVLREQEEIFRTFYETPYFFSARALKDANLEIVELEKVYRQRDAAFVALLNRVRNQTVEESDLDLLNTRLDPGFDPPKNLFYITLTTTNANADRINGARLDALPGRREGSRAQVEGDFDPKQYPTAEALAFRERAQVMMLNNDSAGRWVNGSVGVIKSVRPWRNGDGHVQVLLRDGGGVVSVAPHTWEVIRFILKDGAIVSEPVGRFTQLPFRLAWAVTIHKSQGKTFDRVVIDLERGAFATGQTYVALSRCTSFEGIVLRRPVARGSILSDHRIARFLACRQYGNAERKAPAAAKETEIGRAITRGARIEMTYLRPDNTKSRRTVRPRSIGIEEYGGRSFLGMRAFCEMRRDERMFRVDRILAMEVRES